MTGVPHLPLAPVQQAQEWLLACAPDPDAVRSAWDTEQLASISSGPHWRLAEARLPQSLAALRTLDTSAYGPVVADVRRNTGWWLLPPTIEDELDGVPGITVYPAGWPLECPPPERSLDGRWWLVLPGARGQLADATALAAALRADDQRSDEEMHR